MFDQADSIRVGSCAFGLGVFAARNFEAGEHILRFTGKAITFKEALTKGGKSMNPLQIAPNLYLDLEAPGVYLNHSCEPNAGVRESIFLVALSAIGAGEEIFFDYSTTMAEEFDTMQCLCGTSSCRGRVADFLHLPSDLKRRYLEANIVQPFIAADPRHHESYSSLANISFTNLATPHERK